MGQACQVALVVSNPRSGDELITVALDPADPRFVLSYLHSVHESRVMAGYRVENGGILQIWESFSQPGYGMGAVSGRADIKGVVSDQGGQRLLLSRALPDFILRLQARQKNRLEHPIPMELSEVLGERAVRLSGRTRCDVR